MTIRTSRLPATVIALGLVSFFTDLSSEMIYPLLPLFLVEVLGAGVVALGVIEGIAEATAALLKLASGIWTDRIHKRKPFILGGYTIAGAVRPLIALAGSWPLVLVLRFLDRVGKGLRSSPRDALITDVTPAAVRGKAFGLHRAMDHAGSVAGPLVAAALLHWAGWSLRDVFLAAALPGIIVVVLILSRVHDVTPSANDASEDVRPSAHWRDLNPSFRWFLGALAIFSLGNATDAFILLAFAKAGLAAHWIAVLWAAHHVVKMLTTFIAGGWSDRIGRHGLILAGWCLYALTYLAFAFSNSPSAMIVVFLVYGITFGLTEPCQKALVADLAPKRMRGTAFGYYQAILGGAALPASFLFGLIWYRFGQEAAFVVGGLLALLAAICFSLRVKPGPSATSQARTG